MPTNRSRKKPKKLINGRKLRLTIDEQRLDR